MHSTFRACAILILSALLSACPTGTRPTAPSQSVPPIPKADLRGATVYIVDPAASNVNILVYRGGTLARLGHNHVMTSKAVEGRVWVNQTVARSGFELAFPVNELIVDDPDQRRAAGDEFPPEIPQGDRDGTRKNMLRPEVLDGEKFANVKLQSVAVNGTLQAPTITTRVTIKDAARDIPVLATVSIDGTRLTAEGEFDIKQTEFGIQPFSIGLGALQVVDQLHIKFRIVAQASRPGT